MMDEPVINVYVLCGCNNHTSLSHHLIREHQEISSSLGPNCNGPGKCWYVELCRAFHEADVSLVTWRRVSFINVRFRGKLLTVEPRDATGGHSPDHLIGLDTQSYTSVSLTRCSIYDASSFLLLFLKQITGDIRINRKFYPSPGY